MMIEQQPRGYVSIIGSNYLHPIASLLHTLESFDPKGPNEVQASVLENGYSAAIIVLAVFLLESVVARTQYVRNERPPKKPLHFVRSAYPGSCFGARLEELFVARDVIAHNHVWEAEFVWGDEPGMRLISAEREEGYGDRKYERVLDEAERKTRQLGINLFPTRICREDVRIVLKNAVEFLRFLEAEDEEYINISPQYVNYGGSLRRFVDLVDGL